MSVSLHIIYILAFERPRTRSGQGEWVLEDSLLHMPNLLPEKREIPVYVSHGLLSSPGRPPAVALQPVSMWPSLPPPLLSSFFFLCSLYIYLFTWEIGRICHTPLHFHLA